MSPSNDSPDTFSAPKAVQEALNNKPGTKNADAPALFSASVRHNDNVHSSMPQRNDANRQQAPHDNPRRKPGEGEPSVG